MGWSIAVSEGESVVHAVVSGEITMGAVRRTMSEGMEMAVKHGASKFLADLRAVRSRVSTVQIYLLPKLIEALGVGRDSRLALVISKDFKQEEDCRFYQTVSGNQGFVVGLFHESDKARQWLANGT
jgi:hypothetical protein